MTTAIATTDSKRRLNDRFAEDDQLIDRLRASLNRALRGKDDVVEMVLACLLARGHLLIEDLPGLGKTTLAKALAQAIDGRLTRVQCTPDLMPSDVTGFNIFNQKTREFEFSEGPLFADVLLADEINRATPRTQSALFESMAERQVTVDKTSYKLPPTFFVIATQNPVESLGAFPLPEAQLDRFAIKLTIGYPDRCSELDMLKRHVGTVEEQEHCDAVVTPARLATLQQRVACVVVGDKVRGYLIDLADATRNHRDVVLGLSPRGVLVWQRIAQAWAFLHRRQFATPDDVQDVAHAVLRVRLTGELESTDGVIDQILSDVAAPLLA